MRDALLGVEHRGDIDVTVEGDAVAVARQCGHIMNARVLAHERFGTAVLELPHEGWIDLVTARSERYERPGALPTVTPGTLTDDLVRRDFTINAIAYRLNGPQAGALIDPAGGRDDLAAGLVRVLHAGSFADDPSRILRAVRYAARLGFSLERTTTEWATAAAGRVDPANARVGEELRRLLDEEQAAAALDLAARLGVPWICPDSATLRAHFGALDDVLALPGAPQQPRWALRLGFAMRPEAIEHVAVDGWARGLARNAAEGADLAEQIAGITRPSQLDALLRTQPPARVVAACVFGATLVATWWQSMRDMRTAIAGADLIAAGLASGPGIGAALAWLRGGVLDGAIGHSYDEQLAAALRHVERQ